MDRTMIATAASLSPYVPPAELREHYLYVVEGWQPGLRLRIGEKPLKIGRNAACDVVVPDSQVSSQHCVISVRSNHPNATLTDLNSTNGSFVEGKRVEGTASIRPGSMLRLGGQILRLEYLLKSDVKKADELNREIEKARHYVQSLLPAPIPAGPVQTDWFYLPSTELGGDGFGYHRLTEHTFAGYLFDVAGHGVGAAMHSVSIMNVLRQRALPNTDFHLPSQVLGSLNDMFQMDTHDGMYFSMWYGVYDLRSRTLRYASAGHHPAYLLAADGSEPTALQTRNLVIGAMPGLTFREMSTVVPPGSMLHVFSDGVFEVLTRDGRQWGLPDFLPLLTASAGAAASRSAQLYGAVREVAAVGPLDDDFSMLIVTFP